MRGFSEVGLIAEADDDDQKRIEEDVCTGAAGESTGGVEGKGGDENEGDAAGAEVEGCRAQFSASGSLQLRRAIRIRRITSRLFAAISIAISNKTPTFVAGNLLWYSESSVLSLK